MKKILLFLLLSVAGYGQTETGEEQSLDYGLVIPVSKLQTVTNPTYLGTYGGTGAAGKVIPQNLSFAQADTGVLTFAGLTTNTSTTIDIGAVYGQVVDNETSPASPIKTIVNYAGQTGVTVPTVGSGTASYVMLSSTGVISFQNIYPTSSERKAKIWLGKVSHPGGVITLVVNEPDYVTSPLALTRDLFTDVGPYINVGVHPYPNGANLNINVTGGEITGNGINFVNDRTNPNHLEALPATLANFVIRTQTGGSTTAVNALTPGVYDNAGTITAIGGGAGASTIQHVEYTPGLGYSIQLGQTVYATFNEAVQAVGKETFVRWSNLLYNAIPIGVIVVNKSATALNNPSQALFFNANKTGDFFGAQAGVSTGTFQTSYNNSPVPQIVTTTGLGAVTVKRGSASDTDNILVGQNGAGSNTFSVNGNGAVTGTTWNGYTTENVANKSDSYTASSSTTYASTKALVDGLGTTIHKTGDETKTGKLNLQNLYMYSVEKPVFTTVTDSGLAGVLNGLYYYDITYYNALGETEASGEQSISVSSKQINVTLPVSPDASVIGRRIYRTIANPFDSVIKKLVVDIPNNTATSYVDNIADGSLGVALPRMNSTGSQLFNNTERIGFASKISTSFGLNSFLNNTGYSDTAFGYGVLTANTTGYRNTGVGVFALFKNTTGYNNTAMGVHSLNDNTTGYDNTAFGYGSLIANTTGKANTALGSNALDANLTGDNNVALGASSLQDNLTSNNIGIGYNSARYTNSGSGNLAIGTEALFSNSGGNFNVAIGQSALKATNDSFNTAIGYRAAGDALLGEDNVSIGAQTALNAVGYGTKNVFLGGQSGYSAAGSSNVFLGYQSGWFETGSNKLFIDNIKRANEADARSKALIYGFFDGLPVNQFLTINGNLNVNGNIPSPALTGTPTAPTATAGTNTTQIATTAFVQGIKALTVRKISTNTTLADSDNGTIILLTASCTVTLPNGLMGGFNCSFSTQTGATMTYALGGSVTLINNVGTTMAQNLSHTIVNTGTSNEYLTAGSL